MRFSDIPGEDRTGFLTILDAELYPDIIDPASMAYGPVLERFRELLDSSRSTEDLYRRIMDEPNREPNRGRNKLLATFRRYFTVISTENLKVKERMESTIRSFGPEIRSIDEVRERFRDRPFPDETLMTMLYVNSKRGESGYAITEILFTWLEAKFPNWFELSGPRQSGKDIDLSQAIRDYPKDTKADLLIEDKHHKALVVGFARYDVHRGGSQEDDRIKGNNDNLTDIMGFSDSIGRPIRVLFLIDGPALLSPGMWQGYSNLERRWEPNVVVSTIKMLDERVTGDWIEGR